MFRRYKIADLITEIDYSSKTLEKQSAAYAYDGSAPCDIRIQIPDDFLEMQTVKNPHLTRDDLYYIWTGYDFYRQALNFGSFMMHASAVMYDGHAYLFSANCGTGKSTHASLWQKNFGEENAKIINDDKPLIIKKNGVYHAAGTPWSGKSDKNINISIPIAGIAVIEQAPQNSINPISPIEAFKELYSQTYRPGNAEAVDKLLVMFNELLTSTALFRLKCNISLEAAQTSYEAMRPYK